MMKNEIKNILIISFIITLLLSTIAKLYGGCAIFIETIFEIFFCSALLNIAHLLINKWECPYAVIEIMAQMVAFTAIVLILGILFNWYSSLPLHVLAIMILIVYFTGSIIGVFRINSDIKKINSLLNK